VYEHNYPELLGLINTRRSIRFYHNETVSHEDLEKIVEAGLRAPSSKNSQPWYFLVLQGKEKDLFCDWAEENPMNLPMGVPVILNNQKTESPLNSAAASIRFTRDAGALILIFNRGPFTGGLANYGKDSNRDSMHDGEMVGIGAAMQNILLAAHALGLGSVPMMDLYTAGPKAKEVYGIEGDLILQIAIGHPNQELPLRKINNEAFVKFINPEGK
jgi:nitroreductase